MSKWTLRFKCRSMERAFLAARHEQLATAWGIGSTMALFYATSQLIITVLLGWATSGGMLDSAESSDIVMVRNAQIVWGCCQGVLSMLSAWCPKFRSMLGFVGFEIWVTVMTVITIILLITMTPWYLACAFGVTPSPAMREDVAQDFALLLRMDVVVTVSHLFFNVRWIVMMPAEIAPVLCYAGVAFGVGSSAPPQTVAMNVIMITLLTLAAGLGRRQIEYHERVAFEKVVHEKTRRAEVEHRLARMQEGTRGASARRPADDDLASDQQSAVTSAVTCELFRRMERADGEQAASHLEELARLGYKEHWLVPSTDLRALPNEILGAGGFGMVIRAEYHGAVVALKISQNPCTLPSGSGFTSLTEELRIFRRLRHPNIVLFLGAAISPRSVELMLVMECVHGVPLSEYVAPPPANPSTSDRFTVAHGVACGLMYLHSQRPQIVHGDLKGSNVLVEKLAETVNAKIIDFGLSRLITRHTKPMGGTLAWMAPEVVMERRLKAAPSADTFSFGRLLYMIMAGHMPLLAVSREAILAAIREGHPHTLAWHEQVPKWKELKRMSEACTRTDPSERPGIDQVRILLQTMNGSARGGQVAMAIDDVLVEVRASTGASVAANSSEENMIAGGNNSSKQISSQAMRRGRGMAVPASPPSHMAWPSGYSAQEVSTSFSSEAAEAEACAQASPTTAGEGLARVSL